MTLTGNPVSPGVAVGPLYVYRPKTMAITEAILRPEAVEAELARLHDVKAAAAREIRGIARSLQAQDPRNAKIFDAHEDILNDRILMEEVTRAIRDEGRAGDWAIQMAFDRFAAMLNRVDNPVIRERAADLQDVCARLLRLWHGVEEKGLAHLHQPVILAARDLLPSDTAALDRGKVLAILTEMGGAASHTAILARGYRIPAVLGIADLLAQVQHGDLAAVDAQTGTILLSPTDQELQALRAREASDRAEAERTRAFLPIKPLTADGRMVELGLNIGTGSDDELAYREYADFVGLFRTEFLYMSAPALPEEERQYSAYRNVLSAFGEKPVTLRTLDIGGDKAPKCLPLPREDNPFLGSRALRLCFARPDLFRTQLRAALRASVYGNLWLMLPMVSSLDDIRKARAIIASVHRELTEEGIAVSERYKVGAMIETPSMALIPDLMVDEVDFASIGTNDLCQYLMAADRLNPAVAEYYQLYHPALFRAVECSANAFAAAGKPLSICGELGGDPLAAAVFVGMGIRKLSMGPASLAAVKQMLSRLTTAQARALAQTVTGLSSAGEIEAYLKSKLI